jgi:hypothetical protein
MVDYVNDARELERRLMALAFGSTLPEDLAIKIQMLPGVTADRLTTGAELLYAHKDLLEDDGLRTMAEIYAYANEQGWSGFNQGDRSKRIADGAAYDLGDRKSSPKGDDPEPSTHLRDGVDWRYQDVEPEADPSETTDADS